MLIAESVLGNVADIIHGIKERVAVQVDVSHDSLRTGVLIRCARSLLNLHDVADRKWSRDEAAGEAEVDPCRQPVE